MPAPLDLTGRRFGRLVVVNRSGRVRWGSRPRPAWLCECDCGRRLVVPQDRLPHRPSIPAHHIVTACPICRARPCPVCGARVPLSRSGRGEPTCCDDCRAEVRRATWRGYHHSRLAADPNYWRQVGRARRRREQERPEMAERRRATERARKKRRRDDMGPGEREAERARVRAWYAGNAKRVLARRRERWLGLSPAEREELRERMRAYQRAYRQRWRGQLWADPARHAAYRAAMAEYRRVRALRELAAELAARAGLDSGRRD